MYPIKKGGIMTFKPWVYKLIKGLKLFLVVVFTFLYVGLCVVAGQMVVGHDARIKALEARPVQQVTIVQPTVQPTPTVALKINRVQSATSSAK